MSDYAQSTQKSDQSSGWIKTQKWKINDQRAQKSGPHRTLYWVKKKPRQEDGTYKGEKWTASSKYIGDWNNNVKEGFGVQIYPNGDKYEGQWEGNMRHGQGTYWTSEGVNKLRRLYTGDWENDMRHGRGTYFFKNEDRYDGYWFENKQHGEGRMIYANGDIYEGQWNQGTRSGYGVLTKRNGDHYEGHWVDDKREGQGSFFFSAKRKLFIGEWVNDQPKCGVYTEVQDEEFERPKVEHFQEKYVLPEVPKIGLANPTKILEDAMERARKDRAAFRAQFIPIEEMFTDKELEDLEKAFNSVAQGDFRVSILSLRALFAEMDLYPSDQAIDGILKKLSEGDEEEEITFEIFVRCVALLLEENLQDGEIVVESEGGSNYEEDESFQ
eukprot:CAMPEP_0115042120 /NCGR_PEP_ID=MMETSP0216-20121206/46085_1 /TAXON_ID=223996 /ORGANISM="Protocruzia adherens, Strain Boccale" /LENGTH=382 /DNA_ID=CAMNT_0002424191 /DNA_START=565 /DNA_END=1713 /DNA_ORIENTATION=-